MVTAAIFGLLGVVVGGVLNGVVSRWQVRREQSDAVRAAARLLFTDLNQAWNVVEKNMRDGSWLIAVPPVTAWDRYDEVFARVLHRFDWAALEGAVTDLRPLYSLVPVDGVEADVTPHDLRVVAHVRASRANADPIARHLAQHGTRVTLRDYVRYSRAWTSLKDR